MREREERLCGHNASKFGKAIRREEIEFISRKKISGCERTRPSKASKKGAGNRAASMCLFSRTGSLYGDAPRTNLLHHCIAPALLHPQRSMIESQLRLRWRLRITCQRTARGNIESPRCSIRGRVVFAKGGCRRWSSLQQPHPECER